MSMEGEYDSLEDLESGIPVHMISKPSTSEDEAKVDPNAGTEKSGFDLLRFALRELDLPNMLETVPYDVAFEFTPFSGESPPPEENAGSRRRQSRKYERKIVLCHRAVLEATSLEFQALLLRNPRGEVGVKDREEEEARRLEEEARLAAEAEAEAEANKKNKKKGASAGDSSPAVKRKSIVDNLEGGESPQKTVPDPQKMMRDRAASVASIASMASVTSAGTTEVPGVSRTNTIQSIMTDGHKKKSHKSVKILPPPEAEPIHISRIAVGVSKKTFERVLECLYHGPRSVMQNLTYEELAECACACEEFRMTSLEKCFHDFMNSLIMAHYEMFEYAIDDAVDRCFEMLPIALRNDWTQMVESICVTLNWSLRGVRKESDRQKEQHLRLMLLTDQLRQALPELREATMRFLAPWHEKLTEFRDYWHLDISTLSDFQYYKERPNEPRKEEQIRRPYKLSKPAVVKNDYGGVRYSIGMGNGEAGLAGMIRRQSQSKYLGDISMVGVHPNPSMIFTPEPPEPSEADDGPDYHPYNEFNMRKMVHDISKELKPPGWMVAEDNNYMRRLTGSPLKSPGPRPVCKSPPPRRLSQTNGRLGRSGTFIISS